ncbi:MAG: ABC transporter permease [Actinobacteria bacterium]|nr:ABC transporter permease [Actinomycetota bacterium]
MGRPTEKLRGAARYLLALPAIVWVGLLVIAPNLVLVLYSFWKNELFGVNKTFTLENYEKVVQSDAVLTLMWRSLLIAGGAATLATLIAFPLAYVVVRYFGRFKFYAALLVIVPLWVSFLMRVYSWKIILGENGILNGFLQSIGVISHPSTVFLYSPWAVAVVMTYVGIPYVFLSSYTLLDRIPPNLFEAAADCGASPLRTFRTVIWPIARPAAVIGFMLVFVIVFGDYVSPTLVGGLSGTMVGSVVLQAFGALNNWPYGAALALSTVVMTLVVLGLLSLLLRKRIVLEGETA